MFVATQAAYMCVTGSILCTVYDNIVPDNLECGVPAENASNMTQHGAGEVTVAPTVA